MKDCLSLYRTLARKYPQTTPQDAVKLAYQSVYGCGHLIDSENSARVRKYVLTAMRHMGAIIDDPANEEGAGERRITAPDSKIDAYVIPANEEYMVVRETYAYFK